MKLFTIILDFDGGTYLSQTVLEDIIELPRTLDTVIPWDVLPKSISEPAKAQFLVDISSSPPTLLDGLKNIWCMSAELGEKLAILHVVETCPIDEREIINTI